MKVPKNNDSAKAEFGSQKFSSRFRLCGSLTQWRRVNLPRIDISVCNPPIGGHIPNLIVSVLVTPLHDLLGHASIDRVVHRAVRAWPSPPVRYDDRL